MALSAREVARWAAIVGANRLVNPDPHTWKNTGKGGYIHGGSFATPCEKIAQGLERVADVADPREVARWATISAHRRSGVGGFNECSVGQKGSQRPYDIRNCSDRLEGLASMSPTLPANQPPCFVELCAGTAAVSLRLQGGPNAKPPVSRMGSKRGYAEAILWTLGLRSGQGAGSYVWCEPDDGARLMLQAYPDPETLRAAAAIIRGWADEEPRALWERLKAEGPIGGAEGVARWACLSKASFRSDPSAGFNPTEAGRPAGATFGAVDRYDRVVARSMSALESLPGWPPVTITSDARELDFESLPPGSICYMDPPYLNTTGYAHDLGRDAVIDLARRASDAGHVVAISEAEPIEALGWHHVEITSCRVGQRRTFSKQQAEWLTMNREPAWRPSEQGSLFAMGGS